MNMNYKQMLNQAFKNAPLPENSGWNPLPKGYYQATITGMTMKRNERTGGPMWELDIKTDCGRTTTHTVWGFSDNEMYQYGVDEQKRKAMDGAFGRMRQMMIDCGLRDPDSWDEGAGSFVATIHQLIGKRCTFVVKEKANDPTKLTSFINASKEQEMTNDAVNYGMMTGSQLQQQQMQQQQQPQNQYQQPRKPTVEEMQQACQPPQNPKLEDIPF